MKLFWNFFFFKLIWFFFQINLVFFFKLIWFFFQINLVDFFCRPRTKELHKLVIFQLLLDTYHLSRHFSKKINVTSSFNLSGMSKAG